MHFLEDYISWLCDLVGIYKQDKRSLILLDALVSKEFYWSVPNDDNRVLDGLSLREEYAELADIDLEDVGTGPCCVLEMLVALARRCSEQMYSADDQDSPARWFWEMLENLGLDFCSATIYDEEYSIDLVDQILERLVERTYSRNGRHGLFPLNNATEDQRNVEIWYQMSAYLREHYFEEEDF